MMNNFEQLVRDYVADNFEQNEYYGEILDVWDEFDEDGCVGVKIKNVCINSGFELIHVSITDLLGWMYVRSK